MINKTQLLTSTVTCGLATLITGAAQAESNFCIAVNGGFGAPNFGTTFVGKGFAVPSEGNCTPWSGFTKTASTVVLTTSGTGCLSSDGKVLTISASSADPSFVGAGQLGSDYIELCPEGVKSCPLAEGADQGFFSGTAKEETCTASLLKLPSTHD